MKSCFELFTRLYAFCAEIKTQFNVYVHTLHNDNAMEYFSNPFQKYMSLDGILHQSSCVDTPSWDGVIEWKKNKLLETAKPLLV